MIRTTGCLSVVLSLVTISASVSAQVFGVRHNFVAVDRAETIALNNGVYTRTPAPDTNGAVGPNQVVLFIKGVYRVFDKSTGQLIQQSNDVDFYNRAFTNNGLTTQTVQTTGPSDPRLLYDSFAQRWFALGIDRTRTDSGVFNIAVSNGPDLSDINAWKAFTVGQPVTGWPDFPTVGLNRDGFFASAPIFTASGGSTGQTRLTSIPKSSLLASNPSALGVKYLLPPGNFGFIKNPVVSMDDSPLPALLIDDRARVARLPATLFSSNDGPATLIVTQQLTRSTAGAGTQPGGVQALNNVSDRITSSVIEQNGSIWGVVSDFVNGNASARWFRLDAVSGQLRETGTIASAGRAYLYPSIAVDDVGNIVIGMSGSGTSEFASSYVVAGKFNGISTRFGTPVRVAEGQDTHLLLDGSGRNRWGDYSVTVPDPTRPGWFWTFQEIAGADREVAGIGLVEENYTIQITEVFIPLPGDANIDRFVNVADFAVLSVNFNSAGAWQQGDFDYDSDVDIADFSALAANFNTFLPLEGSRPVVPEPTGALALLIGLLIGTDRRCCRACGSV